VTGQTQSAAGRKADQESKRTKKVRGTKKKRSKWRTAHSLDWKLRILERACPLYLLGWDIG
jgi:hypothetical protein